MTNLKKLRGRMNDAQARLYDIERSIERAKEDMVRPLHEEYKRQRDAAYRAIDDRFALELADAQRMAMEAKAAHDAAAVEQAASVTVEGLPIGAVVEEWKVIGNWSFTENPTGNRGVLEVWTPDSGARPKSKYRSVNPGDVVVRQIKKDGTKGAYCWPCRDGKLPWHWHPEGWKPKEGKW